MRTARKMRRKCTSRRPRTERGVVPKAKGPRQRPLSLAPAGASALPCPEALVEVDHLGHVVLGLRVRRDAVAGAESRKQIGWVIVGGLLLGTVLTLYVVPAMYTIMRQLIERPGRGEPRLAGHGAESAAE